MGSLIKYHRHRSALDNIPLTPQRNVLAACLQCHKYPGDTASVKAFIQRPRRPQPANPRYTSGCCSAIEINHRTSSPNIIPRSGSGPHEQRQNLAKGSKAGGTRVSAKSARIDNEDRILICHRARFMGVTLRGSRFSRNKIAFAATATHADSSLFLREHAGRFPRPGLLRAALLSSFNAINY